MILLSMPMILLSILSANNLNLLLNLNLIYKKIADWHRKWLVDSMLENLNWFRLTSLITLILLMWKWMGLFFRKNHILKSWGWPPLAKLIRALTWSLLLNLPPENSLTPRALICSMKFLSSVVALYLYKSTICPCMEYFCHVWTGSLSSYLELLD